MVTTITTIAQHADLGMPVSGRVRVAALPRLVATTGVLSGIAGQKCALVLDAADYRSAVTDASDVTAFPGSPAWSPPI